MLNIRVFTDDFFSLCAYHEGTFNEFSVHERRKIMKADAKTEAAVLAVLDKFKQTYKNRDIEGLMSVMAPDNDLFMYGTGADEKRIGPEQVRFQAERDWAQTEALDFNLNSHHISAAGPVAWVASEGLGQGRVGGQEIQFPMRMTAVLEQRNGKWLLVQAHVSLPAAAQEEGDSVPV
jgi:ketosteroid isomerase-like protein